MSFPLIIKLPIKTKRLVSSWSCLKAVQFIFLIKESLISGPLNTGDAEFALEVFDKEMKRILDIVAPQHYVISRYVPLAPWFDSECRWSKRHGRKLERVYKKNPNDIKEVNWRKAVENKSIQFGKKERSY